MKSEGSGDREEHLFNFLFFCQLEQDIRGTYLTFRLRFKAELWPASLEGCTEGI